MTRSTCLPTLNTTNSNVSLSYRLVHTAAVFKIFDAASARSFNSPVSSAALSLSYTDRNASPLPAKQDHMFAAFRRCRLRLFEAKARIGADNALDGIRCRAGHGD